MARLDVAGRGVRVGRVRGGRGRGARRAREIARRERLGRFETLAAEDEELVVDREAGEGGERLEHVVDPDRGRWSRMETGGEARVGQVASGEAVGRRVVEPFSRCYPRRSNVTREGCLHGEDARGRRGRRGSPEEAGESVGGGEDARARRAYLVFDSQSSSMVFPECATSINMALAWPTASSWRSATGKEQWLAPRRAADAPSRAPRPARASTPRSTIESRGDDVRDAARRRGEPAAPETVESAESVRASSTRGVARDRRVRIGTLVKSRSESWTCRGRRPRSVFVTGVTSSHTWRRDRTPDPRLARARLETTF